MAKKKQKKSQIPIVKLEFGILNIELLKQLPDQVDYFPGNDNHFIWRSAV
jgi:hypothetical protein